MIQPTNCIPENLTKSQIQKDCSSAIKPDNPHTWDQNLIKKNKKTPSQWPEIYEVLQQPQP